MPPSPPLRSGPGIRRILPVLLASVSGVGLLGFAASSPASALSVHDQASFDAALAAANPGDTIALADGTYPVLQVRGFAFAARVRIVGSRNARLAGIRFSDSRNLSLEGVTLTPPGDERAVIHIDSSSGIVLDRLLVDGRVETAGAGIKTYPSSAEITIQNSELTNCGLAGSCLSPGANGLRILNNTFHDCISCDFIRGGGSGVLIQGNSFERADPGACQENCAHNDHIQIMGGGPWTMVGNRFGARRVGAASIYVNTGIYNTENPIHDVEIVSNLFTGDAGFYGIRIGAGDGDGAGPPERVSIVNNTIFSGTITAVKLVADWVSQPADKRPFVANNIFGVEGDGSCGSGRFHANLAVEGPSCPGDDHGPAHLDADFRPTEASLLVLDRADPAFAPAIDNVGRGRVGLPDRGAFEFQRPQGEPGNPPASPSPAPPPASPSPAPPSETVPPDDTSNGATPASPRHPTAPRLAIAALASTPDGPRAGARFSVRFIVARRDTSTAVRAETVVCSAFVGSRALRPVANTLRGVVAVCAWQVPRRTRGKALRVTIVARYQGSAANRTVVRRIR
jgi:hypothetical protein